MADDNNNITSWEACKAEIVETHGDNSVLSNQQMGERLASGFDNKTGMTPEGYDKWVIADGSPCDMLKKELGPRITREFNLSAPDHPKPGAPKTGNNGPKV